VIDILEPPATLDGAPFTAEALQAKFRQLFPTLLDPSVASFSFYTPDDAASWGTSSPLGTVGHFFINGLTLPLPEKAIKAIPWIGPYAQAATNATADAIAQSHRNPSSPDAFVACSDYAGDHYIFSTVQVPGANVAFNGVHPVNGNRQFGVGIRKAGEAWSSAYLGRIPVRDKDTLFWYTRGVDRCAAIPQFAMSDTDVFDGGHRCFLGVQKNFANYLTGIGAHVEYVGLWASDRHSWDAYVANPTNKLWSKPPA
jgi:hypothetical protein